MFGTIMIIAIVILVMGWIAYGVWQVIENRREKERPRPTTEHLKKVKSSFEEYAKQLEQSERKNYDRKDLQ